MSAILRIPARRTPPPGASLQRRVEIWLTLFASWLCLLPQVVRSQVAGPMDVWPVQSMVEQGTSRQFGAYVPIAPSTIVWEINGVVGGNATIGTISPAGLYMAPAQAPTNSVVTVTARSTAYPTSFASTTLAITRKYPWLWSGSPSSVPVGNFQVSFSGANLTPDAVLLANGQPIQTTYVSSTRLTGRGTAAAPGTLRVAVALPGPGGVTGNVVNVQVVTVAIAVQVTPTSTSVVTCGTRALSASVTGTSIPAVTWSVNGIVGGSAALGTINTSGLYTAPATVPNPATVTVRATSVASATAFAQSTLTITAPAPPPVQVTVASAASQVVAGTSLAFADTVTGSANTAVTWSVNGVVGGSAASGTITSSGLYTAPAVVPNPATITVRATSVAVPSSFAQKTVSVVAPPVAVAWLDGARFLEQSSFGPRPSTLAQVQALGIEGFLDQQLGIAPVPIPAAAQASVTALRQWQLHNYTAAPDQLRQRMAYTLGQILVTSGNKLVNANEMVPWLTLLNQHAFGNYRDLLRDMTRSPSMGKFLDLANSNKPGAGNGANENYPRELLQLFTIGLWELKMDGSQRLDAGGAPIPAYDQSVVSQVALALTGWTYATAPGATPQNNNWEYFGAPMESRQGNHDTNSKSFLGITLPAGQSVEQDLDGLLDGLMQHPNIAPFIATRLIRSLVTSNPSGSYVERVAQKFVDNGQGVRGDLKAVLKAILLDPEARQDVAGPTHGRLKDPILQIAGLVRALNGQFNPGQQLTYLFDNLGQSVLNPPSVFSWFSPLYRIPKSALFGPEFQIHSPTEATLRGNFIHAILSQPNGADVTIDLSPFQAYGNDMPGLVEAANQRLLYGRMTPEMKQVLITAATPGYDARTRIETVLYLTALSGQYAIQH
jgi:hypothetical protein